MIKKKFFADLLSTFVEQSRLRHRVNNDSSDILRDAKQIIFSLHRGDIKEAEKFIKTAEKKIADLRLNQRKYKVDNEGSFKVALEEYVEAKCFYNYLIGREITFLKNVPHNAYDVYLGGICDLTGELVRRAVLLVSDGQTDEIIKIRGLIINVIGQMIKFNLTGKLRSKYDDAKRNLRRIEQIIYDIKIRGNS